MKLTINDIRLGYKDEEEYIRYISPVDTTAVKIVEAISSADLSSQLPDDAKAKMQLIHGDIVVLRAEDLADLIKSVL